MLIWGTKISSLQAFGYSIALMGMVYYKLGQKELKPFISEMGRRWAEFGANKPVLRKLLIITLFIVGIFFVFNQLAPTYAPEYDAKKIYDAGKDLGKTYLGTS